jgi:hypothetical protein
MSYIAPQEFFPPKPRGRASYPRNRNLARPARQSLSESTIQLIRHEHAFDVELHRFAGDLLAAAAATQNSSFWLEVGRLKLCMQLNFMFH